jgi:Ca2+-transporting ATPase
MVERTAWHRLSIDEALRRLESSSAGLTPAEADLRLEQHGPNELVEKKKKTLFMMFLDQFKDFMIIV